MFFLKKHFRITFIIVFFTFILIKMQRNWSITKWLVLSHPVSKRLFLLVNINMLALLHYCFIMFAQLSETCALALSIFAFLHIWDILYIFITMICLFIHLSFLDNGITQLNKFLYYLSFNMPLFLIEMFIR